MKKLIVPFFSLLLTLPAQGQQYEYAKNELERLLEVLNNEGLVNLRKQTTVARVEELKSELKDCLQDQFNGIGNLRPRGKDCDLIDRANHMIWEYNFPGDNHHVWWPSYGPHNYGSYNDKVFFTGNTASDFIFLPWPEQEHYSSGCLFGFTTQKSSYSLLLNATNSADNTSCHSGGSIKFIPQKKHVGQAISLEHIMHRYDRTDCNGSGITPDWKYHVSTIKVEYPQWTDKKSELSSICNDYGTVNLFDYFSFNNENTPINDWNGLSFYLNDRQIGNNLTISSLQPGIHKIKAIKEYDNGTFQQQFQITIRPVSKITFAEYRATVCVNEPLRSLQAYVDGKRVPDGKWSGDGIDVHGNFTPSNAGIGMKVLTYTYTNPQGCTSTASISIDVKPLPSQATISGNSSGCIGDVITLIGSAPDAASFAWFREKEHAPFYEGLTLTRTITGDEELYVRSLSENRCWSNETTPIHIKSYTPQGKIANVEQKDAIKQGGSLTFKFLPKEKRGYTYTWDFGDGETSVETEPRHFFSKAGSFTVTVIAEDQEGCTNTFTYQNPIQVTELPHWTQQSANLNNTCNNFGVIDIFNYFSLDERHVLIKDFSSVDFFLDNDTKITTNILDLNTLQPGIHKITAKKDYPTGTFQEYFTFKIKPSPKISIGDYPKGICQTEPKFLLPVLVNGEKKAGGIWQGEGVDQAGYFDPKVAGLGVKKLIYTYTNPEGCTDQKELEIDVRAVPSKPTIKGKVEGCNGDILTLVASAEHAINYAWYKSNEKEPFHHGEILEYPISKTEDLYVKALNSEFCPSTTSENVQIKSFAPLGRITTTRHYLKQHDKLQFEFHPIDGQNIQKYIWEFGDGFDSHQISPEHCFNIPGNFTVNVTVQSLEGCKNTITYDKNILVEDLGISPAKRPQFPPFVESAKKPIDLNIFPNPFKDWLKFTVTSDIRDEAELKIFDQAGWLVYEKVLQINEGENEILLNDFANLRGLAYQLIIRAKKFELNEILLKYD